MQVSTKTKILYTMAKMAVKTAAKETLDKGSDAVVNMTNKISERTEKYKGSLSSFYNRITKKIEVKEVGSENR